MFSSRLIVTLALSITILVCFMNINRGLFAVSDKPVHNMNLGTSYGSIQEAINDPNTKDGHIILVSEGDYTENVVVHKSVSLVGKNRDKTRIDGRGIGGSSVWLKADGSGIMNFTIIGGIVGIFVDRTNGSLIANNTITGTADYAIYASHTENCRIDGNTAGLNGASGILITNSHDFVVINNKVFSNPSYGLNANDSSNGLISLNFAFNNHFDGIGLGMGTTNCTVCKNTVENNTLRGIWVDYESTGNSIYLNNIVGNKIQAIAAYQNSWDNGFEGNFWGNYTGLDANFDGISDVAYVIDVNNIDHYPLLGRFSSYDIFKGRRVEIVSNSSINDLKFYTYNATIKIKLCANEVHGFCRINIPHNLIMAPYNVTVRNSQVIHVNDTLYDDGHSRWMYISYDNLADEIMIQGQLSTDLLNSQESPFTWIVIVATTVAIVCIGVLLYVQRTRKLQKK